MNDRPPVPHRLRWLLAPLLALVAAAPWLLAAGDLPDPLATHFGAGGRADGHLSRSAAALVIGGGVGAALAWLLWAQRRGPRLAVVVAAYTAGLLAAASASTALVNQGLDRWEDATLGLGWLVPVVLAGAPVAALAGWLQPPDPATATPAPAEPLPLGPTERVAWTGTTEASGVLLLPALALAGFALVGLAGGLGLLWWQASILLLSALVVLWFTSVRVRVDERGVEVRAGVVPWPRVRIPLADIEAARAQEIEPMAWGGWGYRGSLRLAKQAAWVLRRGEGLVLDLTGDRRFAVTVDGAAEAASVVSGLLARRATAPAG